MSDAKRLDLEALSATEARCLDRLCDRFEKAWKDGSRPSLEAFLEEVEESLRPLCLRELLLLEWEYLARFGTRPVLTHYLSRFPNHVEVVRSAIHLYPTNREPATSPTAFSPANASVPGYEVLRELGRGGMCIVYLARQVGAGRLVALKTLRSGATADPVEMDRFHREIAALARLQHPNIVQVFEVGDHLGRPYFSLEYCSNGSLDHFLRGVPLPSAHAAALVETLARAVHAAHQAGVVHRDLKPANILLRRKAQRREDPTRCDPDTDYSDPELITAFDPKVSDFGLAKLHNQEGPTQTGVVLGTPNYMAPEQARGDNREVGPAADVYALGAILYECLTGRPPFRAATSLETVLLVLHNEPAAPRQLQPRLPRDAETICMKCLEKQPTRRYASALEIAEDLHRFQEGSPIHARPPSSLERFTAWMRRHPTTAALGTLLTATILAGLLGFLIQLQREHHLRSVTQATVLVRALETAETVNVPHLVDELADYRPWAEPLLRRLAEESPSHSRARLHASLALLPADSTQVEYLVERLRIARPETLLVIRDALHPYREELIPRFWSVLLDGEGNGDERLRAACVLAAYAPNDDRWSQVSEAVAAAVVTENLLLIGRWADALRPVSTVLAPPLRAIFSDPTRPESDRRVATNLLVEYALDQPELLADLLQDADPGQYPLVFAELRAHREAVLPTLTAAITRPALLELTTTSLWHRPIVPHDVHDALARRQANAAITLARLGQPEPLWPLLRHQPNPSLRSHLIHRLAPLAVDPQLVLKRLDVEPDASARRALILSLGEYTEKQLPPSVRQPLVDQLLVRYRSDPDPGLHGAIDWLLRHDRAGPNRRPIDWGQAETLRQIDDDLRDQSPEGRRWSVNCQGQTLVHFPGPIEFTMGSPPHEPDRQGREELHQRRIDRSFALAARPVTVREFQQFLAAHPEVQHNLDVRFSPDLDCPVTSVTWYEAVQYCRWLSEQEGVSDDQMCYSTVSRIEQSKFGRKPLRMVENYLSRTGYRLPTEAEWEYACRAGASTSRFYGSADDLLDRYAWHQENSPRRTWPVGQLKPNDHGLFDLYGNVWEWCQERLITQSYPMGQIVEDREDPEPIVDRYARVLRGGGLSTLPSAVRSAKRQSYRPTFRMYSVGLRVARTLPQD